MDKWCVAVAVAATPDSSMGLGVIGRTTSPGFSMYVIEDGTDEVDVLEDEMDPVSLP
jgi:hypothetical protein